LEVGRERERERNEIESLFSRGRRNLLPPSPDLTTDSKLRTQADLQNEDQFARLGLGLGSFLDAEVFAEEMDDLIRASKSACRGTFGGRNESKSSSQGPRQQSSFNLSRVSQSSLLLLLIIIFFWERVRYPYQGSRDPERRFGWIHCRKRKSENCRKIEHASAGPSLPPSIFPSPSESRWFPFQSRRLGAETFRADKEVRYNCYHEIYDDEI